MILIQSWDRLLELDSYLLREGGRFVGGAMLEDLDFLKLKVING